MAPFDKGAATEPSLRMMLKSGMIAAFIISLVLPPVFIVVSKQTWLARIGEIFLFALVWISIQMCAVIIIGTASFMSSGLEGTQ